MTKEKLLQLKKKMNQSRPTFTRTDAGQKKKLNFKWRRPKGIHNKLKHQKKGHKAIVKIGYKNPAIVRDLDLKGRKIIVVNNIKDLQSIDKKNEAIQIGANVGKRKKLEMIKNALKEKITILNLKDPQKYVETIEETIKGKKQAQEAKKAKRDEKKKSLEKKKEKEDKKKETVEDKLSDEEAKIEEKKQKDRTLIHGN